MMGRIAMVSHRGTVPVEMQLRRWISGQRWLLSVHRHPSDSGARDGDKNRLVARCPEGRGQHERHHRRRHHHATASSALMTMYVWMMTPCEVR